MELGQAESLGVFHQHETGVGDVHTHLDDGGGDQHLHLSRREGGHDLVLLGGLHFSVHEGHGQIGKPLLQLGGVLYRCLHGHGGAFFGYGGGGLLPSEISGQGDEGGVLLLGLLHGGADHVDLTTLGNVLADEGIQAGAVALVHHEGVHPLTAGRHLVNAGDVQVSVHHQGQGTGDGGGGHDEKMGVPILFGQGRPLVHAEAVLLVGDHQTGGGKGDPLGQKGLCADDHVQPLRRILGGQGGVYFLLLGGGGMARQQSAADAQPLEQGQEVGGVLGGQDARGGHEGGLPTGLDGYVHGGGGADGLAASHVAHDHAVHGGVACQIAAQFLQGAGLCPREGVGKGSEEVIHDGVADPTDRRALYAGGASRRAQPQGKAEELVKGQAALGGMEALEVLGGVDHAQGVAQGAEPLGGTDILGQGILHQSGGGHALTDVIRDHLVGDALGERVHGVQRGKGTSFGVGLVGGACHGVAILARGLHPSVEAEHASHSKGVLQKLLVEEGNITASAVVEGAEFEEGHAPLDAADLRLGGYRQKGGHAGLSVFIGLNAGFGQHADIPPVLVGAGEVVEQILHRVNAQLVVGGLAGGAHARQGINGGMQVRHRRLLSWGENFSAKAS